MRIRPIELVDQYCIYMRTRPLASGSRCRTRPLASFIMWNHVALAHAAHRCVQKGYAPMGYLGYLATGLSLLYHRHYERQFVTPEGIVAKLCVVLVVFHGLRAKMSKVNAVVPSAIVFVLWRLSQSNYERWHQWMHLVVAADVHYFLHCIQAGR